jgi:hypothetical protein
MRNRQPDRLKLKVIHDHAMGEQTLSGVVSELVYVEGQPRAVLGWTESGGVRAPVYISELDPKKLHRSAQEGTYVYDAVTLDPRFDE